jgi:G3E family GTPase
LKQDQLSKLDSWLRSVLWDAKLPGQETSNTPTAKSERQIFEIYRLKGRVPLSDGEVKIVQGVREVFEITDAREQRKNAAMGAASTDQGKLVFIGRNIAGLTLQASYFGVINGP